MPENKPVNIEDLQDRNGLYYAINSDVPYNGPLLPKPVNIHHSYQETFEGVIKDGKFNGIHSHYRYYMDDGYQLFDRDYPRTLYKQSETNYLAGEKHGLDTTWYKNGKKEEEINYANGSKKGLETTYYENGQKHSEISRKKGNKHGLETTWHEDGQKKTEVNYDYNSKEGLETTWNTGGQKFSEINWKNGRQHGLETAWHQNGPKRKEVNYANGLISGLETFWYREGQKERETNYSAGERHGLETLWHYDNPRYKESETNYKHGMEDGLQTLWSSSGEVESVRSYKDGIRLYKNQHHPNSDTQEFGKEDFSISEYGLDNLRTLIDEKIISVNITDYSPSTLNQFINFFRDETAIDYIKQVIDEHGSETIASAYDEEKHKEFVSQIDAKYPNA